MILRKIAQYQQKVSLYQFKDEHHQILILEQKIPLSNFEAGLFLSADHSLSLILKVKGRRDTVYICVETNVSKTLEKSRNTQRIGVGTQIKTDDTDKYGNRSNLRIKISKIA